jgi:hypothetical protein
MIVKRSGCVGVLDHMPAALSLQFRLKKMGESVF